MPKRDLMGQRFGRWEVIGPAASNARGQARWTCRCDCGTVKSVAGYSLTAGDSPSCGCVKAARIAAASRTHGMTDSPEYLTWTNMKTRCLNPNNHKYPAYGGRGITICAEWVSSFEQFYADMGPRPDGTTLDRIDNERGYEPGNCRWADAATQANNRRPGSGWWGSHDRTVERASDTAG